jgi:hypothetical protein
MCLQYTNQLFLKFALKCIHSNYAFYCFRCVRRVCPNLSSAPCIFCIGICLLYEIRLSQLKTKLVDLPKFYPPPPPPICSLPTQQNRALLGSYNSYKSETGREVHTLTNISSRGKICPILAYIIHIKRTVRTTLCAGCWHACILYCSFIKAN